MTSANPAQTFNSGDETPISALYHRMIDSWNRRNADDIAALYEEAASVVGFDGSMMNGREEIRVVIGQIFNDHQTAPYIGKIKSVRFLTPEVALLRAVVGMIPPGQTDINPAVNAIQTLIAMRQGEEWRISLFQNTPAQFHGRPDLAEALTEELRQLL